jgi:hypothetical protein
MFSVMGLLIAFLEWQRKRREAAAAAAEGVVAEGVPKRKKRHNE